MAILNEILGGSEFQGRLMREIRDKRGLAYDVSSELYLIVMLG